MLKSNICECSKAKFHRPVEISVTEVYTVVNQVEHESVNEL